MPNCELSVSVGPVTDRYSQDYTDVELRPTLRRTSCGTVIHTLKKK